MTTIFVFGSNTEGRHGKGATLTAYQNHGAIYGNPRGRQGNSYAIITKELRPTHPPVTIGEVAIRIRAFLYYATQHPDDTFNVTRIGCDLAGFTPQQIAPLFKGHTPNVILPPDFAAILSKEAP